MNEQEKLWSGQFGDAYHVRNPIKNRFDYWLDIFGPHDININSVLELGAGQGDNLAAFATLFPGAYLAGVDVNAHAASVMQSRGFNALCAPVDHNLQLKKFDLVVTRGFLIHVPEDKIEEVYDVIYDHANNLICLSEYFSPTRRVIPYRGYENALWADDFAEGFIQRHPDYHIADYGFTHHSENGDDMTFFCLMR